ncbi:MAG: serine/threonine protein kinase, partial [Planctomycetaceae bacterium]|nr:serine/threonine protein kinase [Planctomycetaceae bacterium]
MTLDRQSSVFEHSSADEYQQLQQLFEQAAELSSDDLEAWYIDKQLSAAVLRQLRALLDADDEYRQSRRELATMEFNDGSSVRETVPPDGSAAALVTQAFPQIPNYSIEGIIDRGGMGVVYRARQLVPERTVAIKMLRMGAFSSSRERDRFLNEANAASKLDHPAIVPVYEVGEVNGEPFISMKFINGTTLEQRLRAGTLDQHQAIRVLMTVSEAIAEANANGIVHRDLKPSNILIDERTETPWVTDFGLARSLLSDSDLTSDGDILGTPGYMAPEQAGHSEFPVSAATDVYGLGAVLYRILTGRPPLELSSVRLVQAIELMKIHDIIPPRERDHRIPRAVNDVCMRALETDPRNRYRSVQEFADDLRRYLEGEAVEARPLSMVRRL